MRARLPRRSALIAAAGVALLSAGLTAAATGTVHAAAASLPDHVLAPYFEAYNGDNPVALSKESGAKYLTFAFIQTAASGSCTAYWNGDTSQPISSSTFGSDIATIQADGGNVIPSFGGESADSAGTDIADSCTSVGSIAQVYENAIADGARISVVNLMTFDYYIGTKQEMATDTETAGSGLHNQLKSLYPSDSSAQLWRMVGVTVMPGIDDYGSKETFTKADAATVLKWAQANGISTLSFWALQRDNGGCVGTKGSDTCSGISQPTWFFSHAFEPITSGGQAGLIS